MKIVRHFLWIVGFFMSVHATAQTGIGTTTPHASAKLDVTSTNKGFLPPRVTLTNSTDNTTIPNPATGLLVYNTGNNAGLVAGYYYWNGSSWTTISTASGSSVSASILRGSRSSAQTGLTNGGNVIFNQVDNVAGQEMSLNTATGQITLAAGRTYRLMAQVPNYQTSSGDTRLQLAWYNETTGAYIGSSSSSLPPGSAATYGSTGGLSEAVITTTTTTVISYRIVQLSAATQLGGNVDFTSTGSYPWFEAQVISGNAPVNGQSVDYLQASLSSNQIISAVGNIGFNTSSGTGITLTSGGFNLTANKTYKLEAAVGGASTGYAYYAWVDNANNILPGGSTGVIMKAGNTYSDAPQDKAIVYYTPTVNTTVYLRVYAISGTLTAYAPSLSISYSSTWASIEQIGSSAIVNPWTLSGANTYNTTGNVGIGTNAPAAKLDVTGDVNVTGKINLTDPTGNVATKVAAFVDAGTYVTLDNIKATVTTSGSRNLSIATVSGTVYMYYSGIYLNGTLAGNRTASAGTFTTSDSGSLFGWTFVSAGDTIIYQLVDPTNNRAYRITLVIMPSYIKNFISIERLL